MSPKDLNMLEHSLQGVSTALVARAAGITRQRASTILKNTARALLHPRYLKNIEPPDHPWWLPKERLMFAEFWRQQIQTARQMRGNRSGGSETISGEGS